jgi:uncharacterized membrane protein YqaE (UPF0057 family)
VGAFKGESSLGCFDFVLCVLLPPLASGVRARGCGAMLFVLLLTLIGWALVAFFMTIDYNDKLRRAGL